MQTVSFDRGPGGRDIRRHTGLYEVRETPKSCPACGSEASRITRTRLPMRVAQVVRDRVCLDCGRHYCTVSPRE